MNQREGSILGHGETLAELLPHRRCQRCALVILATRSARGSNHQFRSAFTRVHPCPKSPSPGCFMNYPGSCVSALQGRCSTPAGLTSSDHPEPRGLHPRLFYSTLSASSASVAAGICDAAPRPASQWTERHAHARPPDAIRRTRPRRRLTPADHAVPGVCTPGCSIRRFQHRRCQSRLASARQRRHQRANGLNGRVTPGLRTQYVGLDPEGGRTDQPGVQTPGRVGSAARPNPEGVGQR